MTRLSTLRRLTKAALLRHWATAQFPFDLAQPCSTCLTGHRSFCDRAGHAALRAAVRKLRGRGGEPLDTFLVKNLDALYALRLRFAALYPRESR